MVTIGTSVTHAAGPKVDVAVISGDHVGVYVVIIPVYTIVSDMSSLLIGVSLIGVALFMQGRPWSYFDSPHFITAFACIRRAYICSIADGKHRAGLVKHRAGLVE